MIIGLVLLAALLLLDVALFVRSFRAIEDRRDRLAQWKKQMRSNRGRR